MFSAAERGAAQEKREIAKVVKAKHVDNDMISEVTSYTIVTHIASMNGS